MATQLDGAGQAIANWASGHGKPRKRRTRGTATWDTLGTGKRGMAQHLLRMVRDGNKASKGKSLVGVANTCPAVWWVECHLLVKWERETGCAWTGQELSLAEGLALIKDTGK